MENIEKLAAGLTIFAKYPCHEGIGEINKLIVFCPNTSLQDRENLLSLDWDFNSDDRWEFYI